MSRVAVVTGGASGIGAGIARHLVAAGHRVAIVDIAPDAVARAASELGVTGQVADVGDRPQVDAALDAVRAELGPIEIMVTSAGVDGTGPFAEIGEAEWARVLRVNLTGTFHCIQAVVGDMVAAGWGRIVTISSSSAQTGAPNRAHYVASKGGVIALTKALALELAPQGITVNTIPPSIVDTPMARAGEAAGDIAPIRQLASFVPVRRTGTPDDIGAACAFLCSEDAGFITGQQIGVNGGLAL
jgi:NAD(P)-dependent dehydrogenase (short-subunit alcohol dehydrogenase family)